VQSGNLKLTSLNIGQASDFADWEAGKRPATYAPIFMAFDDVTSPTAENEMGQVYHTVTVRVMPTAYRVDGQEVSFHGVDPRPGPGDLHRRLRPRSAEGRQGRRVRASRSPRDEGRPAGRRPTIPQRQFSSTSAATKPGADVMRSC
jgi:hypothetical protein